MANKAAFIWKISAQAFAILTYCVFCLISTGTQPENIQKAGNHLVWDMIQWFVLVNALIYLVMHALCIVNFSNQQITDISFMIVICECLGNLIGSRHGFLFQDSMGWEWANEPQREYEPSHGCIGKITKRGPWDWWKGNFLYRRWLWVMGTMTVGLRGNRGEPKQKKPIFIAGICGICKTHWYKWSRSLVLESVFCSVCAFV